MGAIFVPTKEIFIKCTGANEERPFSFFFFNKNIQIKGHACNVYNADKILSSQQANPSAYGFR